MKLTKIISKIKTDFEIKNPSQNLDSIDLTDIFADSRLVQKNSIFFALKKDFILPAIQNGAKAIVCKDYDVSLYDKNDVIFIETGDVFSLLVEFLQIFYTPLPANIYAVTGTNGKTSVAEFVRQILCFLGKNSASIGTLGVISDIGFNLESTALTTPDVVSLCKALHILKEKKVDDVVIEASSIGICQQRLAGIKILSAGFTNFTADHLDYHKSMQEYFASKMMLLESVLADGSNVILNSDIEEFGKIKAICEKKNHKIIEYGYAAKYNNNNLKLLKIINDDNLQHILLKYNNIEYNITISINGKFQVYNLLCAIGLVLSKYDLSDVELRELFAKFPLLKPAKGRMQKVAEKDGAMIFIDFAHTPDAIENILRLARTLTKARLIILFGCGGNRDKTKRKIMGEISSRFSDLVIVTDDNPRNESSEAIRREILLGCDGSRSLEIPDRKEAIKKAIAMLESGDTLILAGKGHENYQIIGGEKTPFDEEKIVLENIRPLTKLYF
jgi:UDP-N-acetylmuramoyl-L-alanyl-D-glutamate--2,6-diaminopimelate ligase